MIKLVAALLLLVACSTHVKVAPVTVQPIHITVDVNMHDAPAKPLPATATTR